MEVLNIWEFLISTEPVGPFRLLISWLPILVGEMVVPAPIITGRFNAGELIELFPSRGVVPSLPVWLTSPGFRKTRATARRVRDDHLQIRRLSCMCGLSTSRNTIRNTRVNWQDGYWEGPVDQ